MTGSILHPYSWEFELMGRLVKYEAAIDANFGPGYLKEHPELVAACLQHAAHRDLGDAIREAATTIESGLESAAT